MPRIPRKFLFDPAEVGIYHCTELKGHPSEL